MKIINAIIYLKLSQLITYSTLGSNESKNFDDLLNNKNVYFFDDKKLDDANLQTHQLISVSEICVLPLSSLSYDAL